MKKSLLNIWYPAYANSNDAFVPEIWAEEGLIQLENNLVAGNLVHRDFENEIKEFGDVVNTRRPNAFIAKRKTDDDNVTIQDAQAPNVPVKLDQWFHTSFTIKDGEMSKSFKNLAEVYLVPAARSLAQGIDEAVCLQRYRFLDTVVGKLGTSPTKSEMIKLKEALSNNKCPMQGRNLLVGPTMEGDLLDNDSFTDADKVGDDGTALREGSLGRKYSFNSYMDQNCPSVISAPQVTEATTAAAVIGATVIGVTNPANFTVGQWVLFAGDSTPQRVTIVGGANITVTPGLRNAVANGAVVSGFDMGAVDQAVVPTGYAVDWAKEIVCDSFTVTPVKGQMATFVTSAPGTPYGLMTDSDATGLYLDRPLGAAIANNEEIALGPQGNYGFGFHRNAIALVTRPLAEPPEMSGANTAVAEYNNLAIRVSMQYQGNSQGLLVTLDILAGVAVLDTNLGAVLLG